MNPERDVTPIVRSWLEEGATRLPDRVLDAVLDQVPATPQRRSWWSARRLADMNTFAKLAIAAAVVVAVGIVGINLLPANGGVGGSGPAVSPSPSPTPPTSPSPSISPQPSPSPVAAFLPAGPLATGTHQILVEGVPVSFTLPSSGWTSQGTGMSKGGEYEQPDSAGIAFWTSAPENVYADPCAHTPLSPPPTASAAGLAAAASKLPGTDLIAAPEAITIDGRPGQTFAFAIRDDIGCAPHDYYLWYDESSGGASGGWMWAAALGSTHRVWIFDVDGKVVFIATETFKGAKPELEQEIQQIIDSIRFD